MPHGRTSEPKVSGPTQSRLSLREHARRVDINRNLQIPVLDLGCGGAGVQTVERELAATDGVVRVYVNPATETAYVDYDPAETDALALVRAVERAGFKAGHPVEA